MTAAAALAASAFKNAARAQWDQSAAGWNDHAPIVRAWLAQATAAMLEVAGVVPGARVLDVAAGSGDQTLDLAQRVGPQGFVLATDLSAEILAFAADNAARAGYANVDTRVADGEELGVDEGGFDAVVCRLGLMFFPDPLRGLRQMRSALRPGGTACTLVFAGPQGNPCITTLMSTALEAAGLPPRDPGQPGGLLSLGAPGRIDALFREAGFRDVVTTTVDAPFRLPSAAHYLEFVRSSASPIQQILGQLDAAAADAAWGEIERRLGRFATGDGWVGPNELLLTAGTN